MIKYYSLGKIINTDIEYKAQTKPITIIRVSLTHLYMSKFKIQLICD